MNQPKNANRVNRRQFFGLAWAVAFIGLLGQIGAGLARFMTPVLEEGAFGTKVKAGRVDDFEIGSVSYFRQSRFYLIRLEDGFLALYRKCTHLGCVVPWDENAGNFNCPCHSSLFNQVGEVLSGPAPRPLDLFPVEIRGDEVYVDTGVVIQRDRFDPSQVTPV
ncbi:MAG: Rieske (2Fe-2S) protein [Chloroflexi bacterium]|nr:MAG: Rieske (2Fe-2S) protein [Chloroflexota bacterium]